MSCSRCNAEAIVKRGAASYCAKCAMARDWEDIIAIVQEERVQMDESVPIAGASDAPQPAAASPAPEPASEPAPAEAAPPPAAEPAPTPAPTAVAVDDAELPADPFA